MALQLADRVRETSTTTGTGTLTLAGAQTGFVTFNSAITSGNTVYYTIVNLADYTYEVGLGTFTATNLLARTAVNVYAGSSGAGTLVTFAAGTKDVFITYPATLAVTKGTTGAGMSFIQSNAIITSGTTFTVPADVRRWKVTLIGGGGGGGASAATIASYGGGGGSAGVVIGYFDYTVANGSSMTFAIGAAGTGGATAGAAGVAGGNTTAVYGGVTYTAGGGGGGVITTFAGGTGGVATASATGGGTLLFVGNTGTNGGIASVSNIVNGLGSDTPLMLGFGGAVPLATAGGAGGAGTRGGGGAGGKAGSAATFQAGGAGGLGAIIIEY